MPRSRPRFSRLAPFCLAFVVLACVLAAPASASSSSASSLRRERTSERLRELQLELRELQVQAQMGTSFWLATQGLVKGIQARMQHARRELRRHPSGSEARSARTALRRQELRLAPYLPSWLAIKALLNRSYDGVKATLLRVRRIVANTLGREPGRGGAAAWQAVFRRPPAQNPLRLDVCPVDGPYFMVDTFGAPRPGGRFHEGDDMQTARGTPILAALPGVVRRVPNSLGGNAAIVDSAGGTYTYYAHMSAYGAEGSVAAGTVIGYAGATGNARGLIPHLHFELHPAGGEAVDAFADLQAVC